MKKNSFKPNKRFKQKRSGTVFAKTTVSKKNFSSFKKVKFGHEDVGIKNFSSIKKANKKLKKVFNSETGLAEAKINPEYLKRISLILGREVKAEKKDTEDYNLDVVSQLDLQALEMMDCGVTDFKNGETIKLHSQIEIEASGSNLLFKAYKDSLDSKRYLALPFTDEISKEFRTRWLLKTDKEDSVESLMKEISNLIPKYMDAEDFRILMDSITAAESRLSSNIVKFLLPLDNHVRGKVRPLTEDERKRCRLTGELFVDERSDGHDLIALKNFVYAMQGNKIETVTIVPGVFLKYMPELNQKGIRAVVCLVEDGKLLKIKLVKQTGPSIPFGPTEAAIALSEATNIEKLDSKIKYYITVRGYVATESEKSSGPIDYERIAKNERAIPASETFLVSFSENNEPVFTRLYFYPEDPSDLNVEHQNGSVCFGSDQTLHSCAYDPIGQFLTEDIKKKYKNKLTMILKYTNEPAVRVSQAFYLDEVTPVPVVFSDKTLFDLAIKISDSILGENRFTYEKYCEIAKKNPNLLSQIKQIEAVKLFQAAGPISSRFLFSKYVMDGDGITLDFQPTPYRVMQVSDVNKGLKDVEDFCKISELMSKGVEFSDAYKDVYGEKKYKELEKKAEELRKKESK